MDEEETKKDILLFRLHFLHIAKRLESSNFAFRNTASHHKQKREDKTKKGPTFSSPAPLISLGSFSSLPLQVFPRRVIL
jgi:hypothetical protein